MTASDTSADTPASTSGRSEKRAAAGKSRRQAATSARRESVLAAALDCFSEKGIEHTTIAHIQQRADCSIGSIYHHFGSKEGIAEELFLAIIQKMNRGMLKKVRQARSAEEAVHAVVFFYSEWSARNRHMARYLHSRDIDFSPEARRRLHQIHRSYINDIFTFFAPFVERGEMRVLPVDTYVPLISGPIQEYVRRWLSGHHQHSPRRVKALFAEAAWNAVKS